MSWYSNILLTHADDVLSVAYDIFYHYLQNQNFTLGGKIAGVHWQYKDPSHAAECTAGYYNTNGNDIYGSIASVFAKYGASFDFTCMEMFDSDQCPSCGPQELVTQTHKAAIQYGVPYGGENALNVYDSRHYGQIQYQASNMGLIFVFAYLRLTLDLMSGQNLPPFTNFVNAMHNLS